MQIGADDEVEVLLVVLVQRTEPAEGAGVVERRVEAAEAVDGLLDQIGDLALPRDVAADGEGVVRVRQQEAGLLQLVGAAARDDNARPGPREGDRGRAADAAARAGDEHRLAAEPERVAGRLVFRG